MSNKVYYVYILTTLKRTVLYTGVTNNLERRYWEHFEKRGGKFTSRYKVRFLVYYETFDSPSEAIKREKQIKAGSRQKKMDLIHGMNPGWKNLIGEL